MAVTIYDVAREAKVSAASVSRVLNKQEDPFISEATRQRIMLAASKLGYRRNVVARALATGLTHTIAIIMYQLGPPYYARVIAHLHKMLQQHRYSTLISQHDAEGWQDLAVDGVLAYDSFGPWDDVQFQHGDTPFVFLGMRYSSKPYVTEMDYVCCEMDEAIEQAVTHLISQGRRRVAFVVPFGQANPHHIRYEVYDQVMRAAGMAPEIIILDHHSRAAVREHMTRYVRERGHPDALFCNNDEIALGAFRGLRDLGIRVPDDVALAGCDNIEDTEFIDPCLTSIAPPVEEMCITAWQFLLRRMAQRDAPPQQQVVKARLIIRESSGGRSVRADAVGNDAEQERGD